MLALAGDTACGKRGDPQPPLPHTPQLVSAFRLAQRGDLLELAYTTPRLTTGGTRLDVFEVELLRAEAAGDFAKVSHRRRVKVAPGETLVETEPLPAVGTTVRAAARAIAHGQPSGLTPVVSLKVQAPPPRPEGMTATLAASGVLIRWNPLILPTPTPPPPPSPTPTPSPGASPSVAAPAAAPSPSPWAAPSPSPVAGASPRLSPSPAASPSPSPTPGPPLPGVSIYRREPSGAYAAPVATVAPADTFMDRSVPPGQRVCYVARSVVGREPLVESAPSDEACLEVRDISPPAAPTGLAVLPREDGVEVSWSPSAEPDLDHYRVYRAQPKGTPERLADVPPTETAYLDRTLPSGATAYYTVTAIDKAGNESPPSAPAEGRRP